MIEWTKNSSEWNDAELLNSCSNEEKALFDSIFGEKAIEIKQIDKFIDIDSPKMQVFNEKERANQIKNLKENGKLISELLKNKLLCDCECLENAIQLMKYG